MSTRLKSAGTYEDCKRILEESVNEIYVFDAETLRFLMANRSARENLGYSASELYELTPLHIAPAYTRKSFSRLLEPLRRQQRNETVFSTDHRRKDGSVYRVEVRVQRSSYAGQPAFVAIALDRSAEQETRENLRLVIESSPTGILMADETGKIALVNRQIEEMFGYSREEILGKPVETLVPKKLRKPHQRDRVDYQKNPTQRAMGAGRDLFGLHKDGHEFPVEIGLNPVSADGQRFVFASVLDITERHRSQVEREALLLDLDRQKAELLCLYRVGESLRNPASGDEAFLEIPDTILPAMAMASAEGVRLEVDTKVYTSGTFQQTEWSIASEIVVNGRRRGRLNVYFRRDPAKAELQDIRKQEEKLIEAVAELLGEAIERKEAVAQVIQASKLASIGELAAGVGHEINNPVNGIINCADILLKDAPDGSKTQKFAELIRSEADRVAKIVRDLLSFSRVEKQQLSQAHLSDVVDVVMSLSAKKLDRSNIAVEINVPRDLPLLHCRSEQLQQVLMNLVINAMHALNNRFRESDPRKKLIIAAEPLSIRGRAFLRLTVEDRGCGIDPAVRERIFDPFFTTKGRDQGTGLGLPISANIVRDHGGTISVESEPGAFTRFYVDLPLGADNLEQTQQA